MYYPVFNQFKKFAEQGNLIPVYREILADIDTPVSALMKLREKSHVFLLESVEGGEKWGRYTFLGSDPRVIFRVQGDHVLISENGISRSHRHGGNPLRYLKDLLNAYRPVPVDGLPRFYGGAVGYLGYDMVHYFEKLPARATDDLKTDDAIFVITDTLIVFDNIRHTIKVVSCAATQGAQALKDVYDETIDKIERLIAILRTPLETKERYRKVENDAPLGSNMSAEDFKAIVKRPRNISLPATSYRSFCRSAFTRKTG